MTLHLNTAVFAMLCVGLTFNVAAQKTVEQVDYRKLAFFPERWEKEKIPFSMYPYEGEEVVFFTNEKIEGKEINLFVENLDKAWALYSNLIGEKPVPYKVWKEKPVIAAVSKGSLTCGSGCGYIGRTGIEISSFYNNDYPAFLVNPKNIAHIYFYEMGRNFYLFGDRHSSFITGFAVFMRYVCIDTLKLRDSDLNTRKTIEDCERVYRKSKLDFIETFTNVKHHEKKARLQEVSPSDQPVMYAAAMLRLYKELGGNEWLKSFYFYLSKSQIISKRDKNKEYKECINWMLCASAAAKKDLSVIFADEWRLIIPAKTRQILRSTDWGNLDFNILQKKVYTSLN